MFFVQTLRLIPLCFHLWTLQYNLQRKFTNKSFTTLCTVSVWIFVRGHSTTTYASGQNFAIFIPWTVSVEKFPVAQIQIPIPKKYLGFGYKSKVFCRNNGWLMENMDKGLRVPKWVLKNRVKIPQMLQDLSAQIVCPSTKVWNFDEKKLHWVSVVCVRIHQFLLPLNESCLQK